MEVQGQGQNEQNGKRKRKIPACDLCKQRKAKCLRNGNPCKQWTNRLHKTRAPRPLRNQWIFRHSSSREPRHISAHAWARTLNEHRHPSAVYDNTVGLWRQKLNLESQAYELEDQDNSSVSEGTNNTSWRYSNKQSRTSSSEKEEASPRPTGWVAARQAQIELVDSLMRWGLLQRHDLSLLKSNPVIEKVNGFEDSNETVSRESFEVPPSMPFDSDGSDVASSSPDQSNSDGSPENLSNYDGSLMNGSIADGSNLEENIMDANILNGRDLDGYSIPGGSSPATFADEEIGDDIWTKLLKASSSSIESSAPVLNEVE